MTELWPWLAVVGLGVLHGLSPASGWTLAAGLGLQARAGGAARAWQALLPLALGHAGSIAVVVLAVTGGLALDQSLAQRLAGAVLVGMALMRLRRGARPCAPLRSRAGPAGLALWSGLMTTAHGTGLMLVPALAPLCLSGDAARPFTASGSLLLAAAAVVAHLAAMLLTTGALAAAACRGAARYPALAAGPLPRHACTAALACTGALLIAGH
jgi:hypothetical protein